MLCRRPSVWRTTIVKGWNPTMTVRTMVTRASPPDARTSIITTLTASGLTSLTWKLVMFYFDPREILFNSQIPSRHIHIQDGNKPRIQSSRDYFWEQRSPVYALLQVKQTKFLWSPFNPTLSLNVCRCFHTFSFPSQMTAVINNCTLVRPWPSPGRNQQYSHSMHTFSLSQLSLFS